MISFSGLKMQFNLKLVVNPYDWKTENPSLTMDECD